MRPKQTIHFMLIIRNILAILLALQVINPLCSCAEPSDQNKSCCGPTPAATTAPHSCCSESTPTSEDNAPTQDDSHLCMCPSDPKNTQDGETVIPSPQVTEASTLSVAELPQHSTTHLFYPVPARTEHHPPGPSIRVIYSVFRL